MTVYSLSLYFFAVWALFVGILVFMKRRDEIGRTFFIFVSFASAWGFTWGMMLDNRIPYSEALYIGLFSVSAGIMIPVTWLDFSHNFLHLSRPTWLTRWLYIFSGFYSILCMSSGLAVDRMVPFQQFVHHVHPGPLHFIFVVMFMVFVSYGFYLIIHRFIAADTGREKEVLGYFLTAMLFGFAGGSPTFLCVYGIDVPLHFLFLVNFFPFFITCSLMNQRLLDVEELKLLTKESRLASLGTISASILHDIRNPLYIVKNLALARAGQYGDQATESFKKIEEHSTRAIETMEVFRNFAAANSGVSAGQEVDCDVILDRVLELLSPQLVEKNIQVTRRKSTDKMRVSADTRKIEHIFLNILQNACEATRSGGTIAINMEQTNRQVRIDFADSGPGIRKEDLRRIFEPFHTTKIGHGGSGLGLFIAKHLTEAENGKIAVHSKLGAGSSFTVSLRSVP